MNRFLRAYLAVLLWMGVIFVASSDLGSARNTSRVIGPLLRWINPQVTEETIRLVQAIVRKSAHVTVYGVLALLAWRGRRLLDREWGAWHAREFWPIVGFCILYAISDEIHQSFVSSRYASAYDVLFDAAGAAAALLALRGFQILRAKREPR